MRRSPPGRAGQFPSSGAFDARGDEDREMESAVGRRLSSFGLSDPGDEGRASRTTTWAPRRTTSGSVTWPTEAAPLVPVTSRQRTAWMLAHVPDYSNQHSEGDGRGQDQPGARRVEVDTSTADPPRWRPTTARQLPDADAQPRALGYRHSQLTMEATQGHSPPGHGTHAPPPQARYHGEESRYWEDPARYFDDRLKAHPRSYERNQPRFDSGGYLSADAGSDIDSVGAVQDVDSETTAEPNVPKTSRYLREMDRRVILERLAQGEKQAPLAKEFNVSRAAISNLYKHRHEILARTDEDPFAKHPKKKKRARNSRPRAQRAHSLSALEDAGGVADSERSPSGIFDTSMQPSVGAAVTDAQPVRSSLAIAKSRALPILLSSMADCARTIQEFRRISERALWLLLEEALASVPLDASDTASDRSDAYPNFTVLFPPCAISMEQETLDATPLLDIFQLMEPQQPSGFATVTNHQDALTVEITAGAGLPHSLHAYNVFLLNVVAASGEAVCAAIEQLVRDFDVAEANVSVVALFTSSEVVAMVQCKYPLAKIVTARIDSSITRRRIASTPVDLIVRRMRDAYSARR